MFDCPICANKVKPGVQVCLACGCTLPQKPETIENFIDEDTIESKDTDESQNKQPQEKKEDLENKKESQVPQAEKAMKNEEKEDIDQKKKQWLEEQIALKDELSEMKSTYKDELDTKKPDHDFLTLPAPLSAQSARGHGGRVTSANYQLAARFAPYKVRGLLYSTGVTPNWIEEGDRFWYQWNSSDGTFYYLVDPARGSKREIFNNDRMRCLRRAISSDEAERIEVCRECSNLYDELILGVPKKAWLEIRDNIRAAMPRWG